MQISDALEYFDKNNEVYNKIAKKIKYIQMDQNKTKTDGLYLAFYDNKKKFLFSSRVEILAKYYTQNNLWVWGWALPNVNYAHITLIKKLLLYGIDISSASRQYIAEIKNELVTSRTYIKNPTQIEIHCALACYLAKQPMMYEIDDIPDFDNDELHEITSSFLTKDDKSIMYQLFLFIVNPPEMI